MNLAASFSFIAAEEICCTTLEEESCTTESDKCCSDEHTDEAEEDHDCKDESHDCFCLQCACCHAPMFLSSELMVVGESATVEACEFYYASPYFFPILTDVWQPPRLA